MALIIVRLMSVGSIPKRRNGGKTTGLSFWALNSYVFAPSPLGGRYVVTQCGLTLLPFTGDLAIRRLIPASALENSFGSRGRRCPILPSNAASLLETGHGQVT